MSNAIESTSTGRLDEASVVEVIKDEIVALFDRSFSASSIRVDVDVFEAAEPLIGSRALDSMDLVQIIAVIEERFDVSLAAVLTGDEPMTLINVARHIVVTS
jgi:acyl carrier protein